MLEPALKEQLKGIFAGLEADFTFDISVSASHESRAELLELLSDARAIRLRLSAAAILLKYMILLLPAVKSLLMKGQKSKLWGISHMV